MTEIERERQKSNCEKYGHYCPNCDNSFGPQSRGEIELLRTRIAEIKPVLLEVIAVGHSLEKSVVKLQFLISNWADEPEAAA